MMLYLHAIVCLDHLTWNEDTAAVLGVDRQTQDKLRTVWSVHHFAWNKNDKNEEISHISYLE